MTLGGTMFTHQCIEHDYCFREALNSLLPICDQVVVVDAESTDGTFEYLTSLTDSKLTILQSKWNPIPWDSSKNLPGVAGQWLANLGNIAREGLTTEYHFALQADEVLHPEDYDAILQVAANNIDHLQCRRLNFWKDPQHLVPKGRVCGDNIVRGAPRDVPYVGDAECLVQEGHRLTQSGIRIFHYGFLRHTDALIKKSIGMEEGVFGTHNPLWEQVKLEGRHIFNEYEANLIPYPGNHPPLIHDWLLARGYHL